MYRLQRILSTAVVLLAVAALVACDSGVDPSSTSDGPEPAVISFNGSSVTVSERDSVVTIEVSLENASEGASAELLFAAGASSASIDDFEFDNAEPVGDEGTAFVVESLDFSGASTQSFTYAITDTTSETSEEVGVFVLQNVSGAEVGTGRFEINISAEGTVELFAEDFSDDDFGEFEVVDVAGAENWETSSAGGADNVPYAVANAFQGASSSNEPSDDWLITPPLNFEGFQSITLTFLNAKQFNDENLDQGLTVLVSTDYEPGNDPTQYTWNDVTDRATYDEDAGAFVFTESGPVDLSDQDFISASTHVAFRYQSSGTGAGDSESWEVDNIVISGEE